MENAALHDNRFEIPFSVTRNSNFILQPGDIDLMRLKGTVDETVNEKHRNIIKESATLEDQIYRVLASACYRYGPRCFIDNSWEKNKLKIAEAKRQGLPIYLTLSFFPAKAPNPLKTFGNSSGSVDMGELASVLRFYEIASLLSRFYQPGVKFLITLDGLKYHDIFGVPKVEAQEYSENIRKMIQFLGIGEYFDFLEETELYPEHYATKRAENIQLVRGKYERKDSEIFPLIEKLRRSAAYSLNLRGIPLETLYSVFDDDLDSEADSTVHDLRADIKRRALEASIQYQGTYRTVYDLGTYEHIPALFRALKCTVHPKDDQIGLATINESVRIFAHHGQGYLKPGTEAKVKNIRVCFAADVLRKSPEHTLIGTTLDPLKYPFAKTDYPFLVG